MTAFSFWEPFRAGVATCSWFDSVASQPIEQEETGHHIFYTHHFFNLYQFVIHHKLFKKKLQVYVLQKKNLLFPPSITEFSPITHLILEINSNSTLIPLVQSTNSLVWYLFPVFYLDETLYTVLFSTLKLEQFILAETDYTFFDKFPKSPFPCKNSSQFREHWKPK